MRCLPLFLSAFLAQSIFGQEKLLEVPLETYERSIVYDNNSNGNILLTLVHNNGIKRLEIYNDSSKKISEIQNLSDYQYPGKKALISTGDQLHHAAKCLTGIQNESRALELFNRDKSPYYTFALTDLSTDKIIETDTVLSNASEKLLCYFSQNDQLYLIFYKDFTNELVIHRQGMNEKLVTQRVQIKLPKIEMGGTSYGARIRYFADLFKNPSPIVLTDNLPCPTICGAFLKKVFIQNGKMIASAITSDYHAYVVSIDLLSGTFQTYEAGQDDLSVMGIKAPCSLHIIDSTLIMGYVSNNNIKLNIYNYKSGELLKSMMINEKNFDQFSSDTLSKKAYLSSATKNISFGRFIDLVNGDNLSVSAYRRNGNLVVNLGANYDRTTPFLFALSVLATAGSTYAINAMPNTFGFGLFYFYQKDGNDNVSFNTVLNEQFEHSEYSPQGTISQSLSHFIAEEKIKKEQSNVFTIGDHYYLGYYDKVNRNYLLYRF